MTNPSMLATKVADAYLSEEINALELKKQKEIEATAGGGLAGTVVIAEEKLKEKAGIYCGLTNGELRRITLREGKLWIDDLSYSRARCFATSCGKTAAPRSGLLSCSSLKLQ